MKRIDTRTPENVLLKRHRKSAFREEVLEPLIDYQMEVEKSASGVNWLAILMPALARFGVTNPRRLSREDWPLFIKVIQVELEFVARFWLDQYQTPAPMVRGDRFRKPDRSI